MTTYSSANEALCLALMRADSQEEVVTLLQDAGYWDDDAAWRFLGDWEGNWSAIGNQQSEAVGLSRGSRPLNRAAGERSEDAGDVDEPAAREDGCDPERIGVRREPK